MGMERHATDRESQGLGVYSKNRLIRHQGVTYCGSESGSAEVRGPRERQVGAKYPLIRSGVLDAQMDFFRRAGDCKCVFVVHSAQ